ncbi:MAG TPA: hypothetical protein VJ809_07455 [Pirellulales bacterium]|nr:hypothetical protein [Pirellulales bacterium]
MLRAGILAFIVLNAVQLDAQQPTQEKEFRGQDAQRVAAWLKVSLDHAAQYRLAPKDKPDAALKMLPNAVFRHSQPVRGDDIGAVYLWVDESGLPGALGTVFAYSYGGPGERWVAHEFHSLASTPLMGKWRDASAWSPAEPGVEWKEVPKAPPVVASATARLRQMREIGRRVAVQSTDANDSRWELRLITQPIYQYTARQPADTLGGGVFLFCQGTDPEVILLLEAREVDGRQTWHYALAPFTDYGLSVSLDGNEVWSLAKGHRPTRTSPHWWNGRMEVKKLTVEEEAELAAAFKAGQVAESKTGDPADEQR